MFCGLRGGESAKGQGREMRGGKGNERWEWRGNQGQSRKDLGEMEICYPVCCQNVIIPKIHWESQAGRRQYAKNIIEV